MAYKDITGRRFGNLIATENTLNKSKSGNYIWNFICDCGNSYTSASGNILFGHTTSCGCNKYTGFLKRSDYHGMKDTKIYKSWCKIKERCYNINDPCYPAYGKIGITFEFKDSFVDFYTEVGEPPNDGKRYSIDRIDNDLGYIKGNMRWATDFQQARNKGKMSSNSSGVTGVNFEDKLWPDKINSTMYVNATWCSLEGKARKKSFSVSKYGLLPAFAEAVRYRKKMIEELNSIGAGYTEKHGL